MEESICNLEFCKGIKSYIVKIRSDPGGLREYHGETFESVLEQAIMDLQDEFV